MPAAIPIVIGIAAGASAVAVGVTVATAIVIGSLVATTAALMSQPKPGMDSPNVPGAYSSDPTQLTISTDAARRLVYGRCRVSGVMVYSNIAGENNEFLYMVVALAAHKISNVSGVWLDGEPASEFGSKLEWWFMDGDDDQEAHPELVSAFTQWTPNHRLRGIAYAIVKMTYDKEVWKNGPPRNLQFDIDGKPVFDPRTGATTWSKNPVLNMYDYMQSEYGLNAKPNEFSLEHIKTAADICDEKPPTMASSVCDGRYTANGVIELSTDKAKIIEMFTTSMAGAMVWSEGVYYIYAGAHVPPVLEITEDQLAGVPQITPQNATDQTFNTVKGTFLDSSNGWNFSDFPPIKNDKLIEEDGEQLIRDIQLPLTCSWITAQRLATIFLRRERLEETITLKCDWSVYNVAVWDTIQLTIPTIGYNKKEYQVARWDFRFPTTSDPGGVTLLLREYSKDIYSDDIDFIPESGGGQIDKPDTSEIKPPSNLTVKSDATTIDPATLAPRVLATWREHTNPFCIGYEVRAFKNGVIVLNWSKLTGKNTTEFYLDAEANARYEIELRAVNSYDKISTSVRSAPIIAKGNSGMVPDDVKRLIATPIDGEPLIGLEWTAVSSAVSYIVGFETGGMISVLERVNAERYVANVQRKAGNFLVWAINAQGNRSASPAKAFVSGSTVVAEVELADINDIKQTSGLYLHLGRELVPESRTLAAELDDRLWSEVVPDPVLSSSFWSNPVNNQAGVMRPGGAIFFVDVGETWRAVHVAGAYMSGNELIKFTGVAQVPENAAFRVGAEFSPVDITAVIRGSDAYITRD